MRLRTWVRSVWLVSLLVGTMLVLSGCWSFRSADPGRQGLAASGIAANHWPARAVEPLARLADATPSSIYVYKLVPGASESDVKNPEVVDDIRRPRVTLHYEAIHGKCLVRIFDEFRAARDPEFDERIRELETRWTGFLANARVLTSRTIAEPESLKYRDLMLNTEAWLNEQLATKGEAYRVSYDSVRYAIDAGLNARVPPVQTGRPRGVLIHLTALVGNPFEIDVMNQLARRGWVSIDIDTQTRVMPDVPARVKPRLDALRKRSREITARRVAMLEDGPIPGGRSILRMTYKPEHRAEARALDREEAELTREIVKLSQGTYEFCPGDDPDAMAQRLASELDNAIAGNAYAVEAMVDYIKTARPDLRGLPIVVIGFSAGGLATPAAVARVRDDVDAAIIIGGGSNLLMLSQESSLTDGGVRLRCDDKKLPRRVREDLYRRYLTFSKLDPYHASRAMLGMPVLQVHGRLDGWVPARGGEELWHRLGKPDRLNFLGGHQLLFYFLPSQAEFLGEWLDKHVRRAP